MAGDFKKDVSLSRNSKDKPAVRELKRLLSPQAPVKMLSGGERNRLLLARLFARPANVLVLGEPTNDLDIESLELLEDTLQSYPGTLLVVSHDRAFLDSVVTQTLVAERNGKWQEYAGGYSDWLSQRPVPSVSSPASVGQGRERAGGRANVSRVKLSYKEARELEQLPAEIEALEREQHELTMGMSRGDYHKRGAERIKAERKRTEEIERQLAERVRALDEARREDRKGPVEPVRLRIRRRPLVMAMVAERGRERPPSGQ